MPVNRLIVDIDSECDEWTEEEGEREGILSSNRKENTNLAFKHNVW